MKSNNSWSVAAAVPGTEGQLACVLYCQNANGVSSTAASSARSTEPKVSS